MISDQRTFCISMYSPVVFCCHFRLLMKSKTETAACGWHILHLQERFVVQLHWLPTRAAYCCTVALRTYSTLQLLPTIILCSVKTLHFIVVVVVVVVATRYQLRPPTDMKNATIGIHDRAIYSRLPDKDLLNRQTFFQMPQGRFNRNHGEKEDNTVLWRCTRIGTQDFHTSKSYSSMGYTQARQCLTL